MKNRRWLWTCFALALAGILVSAELSWAQCGGYGPRGQGYQVSQTGWRGRGPAYANGSNYADYRYCAQGQGNYAQGPRGPRRGVPNNSPNSQTTNPQTTQ